MMARRFNGGIAAAGSPPELPQNNALRFEFAAELRRRVRQPLQQN
jgi:hypothetical protein